MQELHVLIRGGRNDPCRNDLVQHHTISAVHRLSRYCTLRAGCESDFPVTDRGSITFRCLMSYGTQRS
jgi:hypothetical protein